MSDRKPSYKTPPAIVRDTVSSQASRRKKALEEQKRRRAERIDSSRQLDFFADLSLGHSDDEDANDVDPAQEGPSVVREGVAQFASMLPPAPASSFVDPSRPILHPIEPDALSPIQTHAQQAKESLINEKEKDRKKGKRKGKGKGKARQSGGDVSAGTAQSNVKTHSAGKKRLNKWSDRCMYAELLEMTEEVEVTDMDRDGIPEDIETGWVAVAPVPVGKRCLAVTHQASGIAGVVSNTTLRSRMLGKPLMKPFPSPLPPQTILDCILDDNWRENGILHVLDVLQWKAQDVTECETAFRFWWRNTRLSELPSSPPPPNALDPPASLDDASTPIPHQYQFPYPSTFLPVPYHTDTTIPHLLSHLIPVTRSPRSVSVSIPISMQSVHAGSMDLDLDGPAPLVVQLQFTRTEIKPDGLLLYVAQATYEPGTSPLSSWVPIRSYEETDMNATEGSIESPRTAESPLDVFERLLKRRSGTGGADGMDLES